MLARMLLLVTSYYTGKVKSNFKNVKWTKKKIDSY